MKHVGISKIVAKMSLYVTENFALKEACVLFDFCSQKTHTCALMGTLLNGSKTWALGPTKVSLSPK